VRKFLSFWEGSRLASSYFYTTWTFDFEAIAAMTETFDTARTPGDLDAPEVEQVIAERIIAAAKPGRCDRARLLEAALREASQAILGVVVPTAFKKRSTACCSPTARRNMPIVDARL
jgi:hypothetical protein